MFGVRWACAGVGQASMARAVWILDGAILARLGRGAVVLPAGERGDRAVATTGQVREFPVPARLGSYPGWITAGPDGAIWFTVSDGIARMTTSGTFSVVWKGANYPGAITTGRDGNLWFTVPYSDEVGRLTPSGHATLFRIATNCYPGEIGPGAGFLWVTCQNLSLVYRISTNGAITPIT